jgi:hypothetical protein
MDHQYHTGMHIAACSVIAGAAEASLCARVCMFVLRAHDVCLYCVFAGSLCDVLAHLVSLCALLHLHQQQQMQQQAQQQAAGNMSSALRWNIMMALPCKRALSKHVTLLMGSTV